MFLLCSREPARRSQAAADCRRGEACLLQRQQHARDRGGEPSSVICPARHPRALARGSAAGGHARRQVPCPQPWRFSGKAGMTSEPDARSASFPPKHASTASPVDMLRPRRHPWRPGPFDFRVLPDQPDLVRFAFRMPHRSRRSIRLQSLIVMGTPSAICRDGKPSLAAHAARIYERRGFASSRSLSGLSGGVMPPPLFRCASGSAGGVRDCGPRHARERLPPMSATSRGRPCGLVRRARPSGAESDSIPPRRQRPFAAGRKM